MVVGWARLGRSRIRARAAQPALAAKTGVQKRSTKRPNAVLDGSDGRIEREGERYHEVESPDQHWPLPDTA